MMRQTVKRLIKLPGVLPLDHNLENSAHPHTLFFGVWTESKHSGGLQESTVKPLLTYRDIGKFNGLVRCS